MQCGYFDDQAREYVITRPDTPAPWANYLGSPEYGALISNNAGGYSFVKSGANGRILRYVFNQFDQPGRYIYLRDNASGDFWSASWQPVGKPLDVYQCQCRHGMGYTKMTADYCGIHSEAAYYVPLDAAYEVWRLTVTNRSAQRRELTLTGYAEFTNNGNYEQDQVNLQGSHGGQRPTAVPVVIQRISQVAGGHPCRVAIPVIPPQESRPVSAIGVSVRARQAEEPLNDRLGVHLAVLGVQIPVDLLTDAVLVKQRPRDELGVLQIDLILLVVAVVGEFRAGRGVRPGGGGPGPVLAGEVLPFPGQDALPGI